MRESRDVLTRPAPPPDSTVSYGPHPDQVIDLRYPAVLPAPLVVLLHGGFWRAEWDRSYVGPMAHALREAGFVVAVPEFRRSGSHAVAVAEGTDEPGDLSGWPATFDDVAAALDAVPALAEGADLDHMVWTGHSAGGHLALWAASRHRLPSGCRWSSERWWTGLAGVVPLAGCCDLGMCARLHLDDDAVVELLGGPPTAVADRYAAVDPVALVPIGVPVTLLHGIEDARVPIEVSRSYASRARAAGDGVELRELPGVEHFSLVDPKSAAWPRVRSAIDRYVSLSGR